MASKRIFHTQPFPPTGHGMRGVGLGKPAIPKRHRKALRDNILGVTRGSIRRLARRGGVVRISDGIYDEIRIVLKNYLSRMLRDVCYIVDYQKRKTIQANDRVRHPARR